jgi:dTDP-4-dehydrorhamnose reductase
VNRVGAGAAVTPTGTEQFPRPARRPSFSVLDKRVSWQLIGYEPPHWRVGVLASTMELLRA